MTPESGGDRSLARALEKEIEWLREREKQESQEKAAQADADNRAWAWAEGRETAFDEAADRLLALLDPEQGGAEVCPTCGSLDPRYTRRRDPSRAPAGPPEDCPDPWHESEQETPVEDTTEPLDWLEEGEAVHESEQEPRANTIRDAVGVEGDPTYTMPGYCLNCDWEGTIKRDKGYRIPARSRCPNCGCRSVVKRVRP